MYTGRIDRTGYFVGTLFLIIPVMLGVSLYALLAWLLGELSASGLNVFQHFHSVVFLVLFVIGVLWIALTMPVYIGLLVRRLHDIDHSGWFVLLNFIPIASTALYLVLLFYPGSKISNRYGEPCSPRDPAYILFAKKLYQNKDFIPPMPPPIDIPPPR